MSVQELRLEGLHDVAAQLVGLSRAEWPPPRGTLASIGVEPAGKSTHAVFRARVDGVSCAIKVFRSWARDEHEREWSLLHLLHSSDIAPEPVWRGEVERTPVIVSTWLPGDAVADGFASADLDRIATAHNKLWATTPPADLRVALSAAAVATQRITNYWGELPGVAAQLDLPGAVRKRLERAPFAESPAVARLIDECTRTVCRGDTNLANYVRANGVVRFLDFEDAGLAEPIFEVADMLEHFANRFADLRALPSALGLDDDAVRIARGVIAEFWFCIIIRRAAQGLGVTPAITASEQLARLEQLGAT